MRKLPLWQLPIFAKSLLEFYSFIEACSANEESVGVLEHNLSFLFSLRSERFRKLLRKRA